MDQYEEEESWDTLSYPKTDSYMIKRVGSYIFDLAISAFIVIFAFYLLESDLNDGLTWLYIAIATGVLNFMIKMIMESASGRSFGKMAFGMIVIGPEVDIGFGQALVRNLTAIVPFIGPLFDLVFGRGGAKDDRQKLSDNASNTLVIEDIPIPVEEPVRRVRREPIKVEPPKPKEKVRLDYRSMRVGHCPRCGAPYRVLPPDDPSFSGLWNHRCTWCNHRIQEDDRI